MISIRKDILSGAAAQQVRDLTAGRPRPRSARWPSAWRRTLT